MRRRGTPGTFRRHCFQSCVYSDETTWRPRWKIPIEHPWRRDFRDSKFHNVPRCLDPQKRAPLVRVPRPPTIHYQPAIEKLFDSPARVHKSFIGNLAKHFVSLFDRNKTQPQTSKKSEQWLASH